MLLLAGAARSSRGPDRAVGGATFAIVLAWALHAGVDWDWEMPGVTIWLFALGGCAIASAPRRSWGLRPPVRLIAALLAVALGVPSAVIAVSQSRLEASASAFARGDCAAADERAQAALSVIDVWPRAYETMGYCRLGNGRGSDAIRAMGAALDRDPEHWRYRYGLAVALATAGRDPRSEAAAAARLSPREPFLLRTPRLFGGQDPEGWRRQARGAPVPADPNS
jgi:hypothetical protein